jgi:hypothetical protein
MTDFILPEGYGRIVYPEELLAARVKELEAENERLREAGDRLVGFADHYDECDWGGLAANAVSAASPKRRRHGTT